METAQAASTLQLLGAGGLGAILGWYVYYINRYRKGDVQLSDIVTLFGVLGGASVTALFPAGSDLFGAFGIGVFCGFFGYFCVLVVLVSVSPEFDVNYFLDGRRKQPKDPWYVPGDVQQPVRSMGPAHSSGSGTDPAG